MSTPSPVPRPERRLDLQPLTEPVPEPALNAFIADSKATGKPWRVVRTGRRRPGVGDVVGPLVPVLVPLAAAVFLVHVGGRDLVSTIARFVLTSSFPYNLVIVGVLAVGGAVLVFGLLRTITLIRSLRVPRRWWAAAYRLVGFAAANDLRYGHDEQVSHPGVIFGTGSDRVAARRLTTTAGRPLEIGNYRYSISHEDREPTVHTWGYVAITLDRRLPHLLLDAKANRQRLRDQDLEPAGRPGPGPAAVAGRGVRRALHPVRPERLRPGRLRHLHARPDGPVHRQARHLRRRDHRRHTLPLRRSLRPARTPDV